MLDSMRRGASGIFAKILFGVLIFAFGIWGIADVFRGRGQDPLATVGSTSVSEDEYRQAVQRELVEMGRQFGGQPLTIDQARQLAKLQKRDFDRTVLEGLMDSAAVDYHVRDIGLKLSDEGMIARFRTDPRFVGMGGQFSREAFDQFVMLSGFRSERAYIDARKGQELRSHIFSAVTHGVLPSDTLIRATHRYREDGRVVEYITLDPKKIEKAPEPAEAEVKQLYERNLTNYKAPEYRKASVLILSPDALKKKIEISDADVQKAFADTKESYETPERRRVHQLSFRDRTGADKLVAEIKAGKKFEEAAATAGFKDADFDLGSVTRKEMIDPAVAEAAFKLAKDVVSDVVAGQLSFSVLRVTEIAPGKSVTFDDVKAQVRDKLAVDKARPLIPKMQEQVDEARGSRTPLAKIAEKFGLIHEEIAAIDRNGKAPNGEPAFKNQETSVIVRQLFDTPVNVEREPLEIPGGGYIWGDVYAITVSRQKSFDEVKGEIARQLKAAAQDQLVRAFADKQIARLKSGTSMADLAKDLGLKLETTPTMRRSGGAESIPRPIVERAYAMAKDAVDSVLTDDGQSRIILRLKEHLAAAEPTGEQIAQLRQFLAQQLRSDVENEYVAAVRDRVGSRINETIYKRMVGAADGGG